jgi:hypothetical protein
MKPDAIEVENSSQQRRHERSDRHSDVVARLFGYGETDEVGDECIGDLALRRPRPCGSGLLVRSRS